MIETMKVSFVSKETGDVLGKWPHAVQAPARYDSVWLGDTLYSVAGVVHYSASVKTVLLEKTGQPSKKPESADS